jgi:hypothetical protein
MQSSRLCKGSRRRARRSPLDGGQAALRTCHNQRVVRKRIGRSGVRYRWSAVSDSWILARACRFPSKSSSRCWYVVTGLSWPSQSAMGQGGVHSGGFKECVAALAGVLPGGDTTCRRWKRLCRAFGGGTRSWPLPAPPCAGSKRGAFHNHELCIRVENGPFRRLSAVAAVRKDRRKSGERILEIRNEIILETTVWQWTAPSRRSPGTPRAGVRG